MSKKIIPLITPALLQAQVEHLAHNCDLRVELLDGLPHAFGELVKIVPPKHRAALSRGICYVSHELDLTQENLLTVLICCRCLQDIYLR
jgi:hypothetical protein